MRGSPHTRRNKPNLLIQNWINIHKKKKKEERKEWNTCQIIRGLEVLVLDSSASASRGGGATTWLLGNRTKLGLVGPSSSFPFPFAWSSATLLGLSPCFGFGFGGLRKGNCRFNFGNKAKRFGKCGCGGCGFGGWGCVSSATTISLVLAIVACCCCCSVAARAAETSVND